MTRFRLGLWLARLLLALVALLMVLPIIYQLGLSVRADPEMFSGSLWPVSGSPTLSQYQKVLDGLPIGRYTLNSLVFAMSVTLGQLALAIPASFALSRLRPPGHRLLLMLMLVSMMVPFVVTYLPNYLLMAKLNLLGTLGGIILPMLASGYGIFLLHQHFEAFPQEIMDAAAVDGATPFQTLWWVMVPAHANVLAALAVTIFIQTWNQFIWPQLVAGQDQNMTLTVAVARYANGEGGNAWGPLMACATLATLPTLLLYLPLRRPLMSTFTEGALKG